MKTQYNGSRMYVSPKIERIELDNDISLQLESTPPPAPGEAHLHAPEHSVNYPFKTNQT